MPDAPETWPLNIPGETVEEWEDRWFSLPPGAKTLVKDRHGETLIIACKDRHRFAP